MCSSKVIITLWVRWKKLIKPHIELYPADAENAQEERDNTGDKYTRAEMPFNSLMTEFFKGSAINGLIPRMLAHIKMQVEYPRMPESGFTLDQIMYLYIKFR